MTSQEETARLLMLAAIAAGVMFFIVPTIEVFRRPGFDLARHAISMLSLGKGGWIMKSVFIFCGFLTVLAALGIHLHMGRTAVGLAAALLVAAYGAGQILAGIFDAPPGLGFPPGVPDDQTPVMTTGAQLHGMGFMIAFGSLNIACFVFAVHFLQHDQTILAVFSAIVGLAMPSLIGAGMSSMMAPGIAFYWATILAWLWLGTTVIGLIRHS